jgi:predicted alpha/beta-fold hydrolase
VADSNYRRAWWLRSPHAQTIWGRIVRRFPRLPLHVERLRAADGEELELHSLEGSCRSPRVLLLHGLEGTPRSHYVGGLLSQAHARGWPATLLVFRGCGAAPNHARRFYHSGETTDLATTFAALSSRAPDAEWLLVGVSLGGNVMLKWLGENAASLDKRVRAAAAISVPYDLEAGAREIGRGRVRIYDRHFLRSLRRKALRKLGRYPDLFDAPRLRGARTVFDFDDVVTAPVHGFSSAIDYYSRSSSEGYLSRIGVPTLLMSAADDPFLPRAVFERVRTAAQRNRCLTLDFTEHGGHVGFVAGRWPWRATYYAEARAFRYFDAELNRRPRPHYD